MSSSQMGILSGPAELSIMDIQDDENGMKSNKLMELKSLMKQDPEFENIYDGNDHLIRYLIAGDFNVNKALEKLKIFYDGLLKCPEWFPRPKVNDLKSLIEKNVNSVLDQYDREGRPIIIFTMGNVDPDKMEQMDLVAVTDLLLELLLENPAAQNGLCVIIDIKGLKFKLCKWFTPHNIRMGVKRVESMPFKNYRIHVVNSSYYVQPLMKVMWPFLPEYLKNVIFLHYENFDELHKHIDPAVLPVEYKGNKTYNIQDLLQVMMKNADQIERTIKTHRTDRKSVV